MILTADHILPIAAEPIERGAVRINNGVIEAVGPRAEIIETSKGDEVIDLGAFADFG